MLKHITISNNNSCYSKTYSRLKIESLQYIMYFSVQQIPCYLKKHTHSRHQSCIIHFIYFISPHCQCPCVNLIQSAAVYVSIYVRPLIEPDWFQLSNVFSIEMTAEKKTDLLVLCWEFAAVRPFSSVVRLFPLHQRVYVPPSALECGTLHRVTPADVTKIKRSAKPRP